MAKTGCDDDDGDYGGDDNGDDGGDGGRDHNDDFDYGDGAVHRPPVLSSEDIDLDMMARKHC